VADLPNQLSSALADRYRLERELGRGGMATVYLAQDLRHDRPVALKVLHPELAQALGADRFQREVRLAARLQHPHILTVHDSGEAAGQLWFTMPFVAGESLRDRLNRETQLSVDDALRISIDAARALGYAHEHGVIHRDIKPENLLLTKDGSTLVADFGIARALSGGGDALTQTGMSIGTPAYMSPEQAAADRAIDARTDVYSLGTVLYEMLAGEPPFTGPTAQAVIARRFSGEVPRLRQVRPSVPEQVEQAVSRALAPVAADRFASAAEFARALQAPVIMPTPSPIKPLAPLGSPTSRPPAPARRGRRKVPVAAVTLVLGLLIGLGVLFAWRQSQPGGGDERGGSKSVAVLPFENLGGPDDEYFADGITDAIRGKLTGLPNLQVTARSSSNEYKKTAEAPQQIGQELGVQYLLTGTVRWEKRPDGTSRVQVTPELIEVTEAAARWQQPFDAPLTDVFEVQGEIAGRVAQALGVALGTKDRKQLAEKPTTNLAAYEAYLKGQVSQDFGSGEPESLRRSAGYYEQAVALDSNFAEAWAQLSRAHSFVYLNGTPRPSDARRALAAAERARALAPREPGAYLALGDYFSSVEPDFPKALNAYEAGLRVAPSTVDLLSSSALAEVSVGQWREALAHFTQAQALDPRSVTTARRLAYTLLRLRRYPETLAACNRALALDPANLDVLQTKAMVFLAEGDLGGARRVLREAPADVEPTGLVAFFGLYFDLYWVLDAEQQNLLLRLPPSAFDDRAAWAIVLAQAFHLRGDLARARAYADSARVAFEDRLRGAPEDAQSHVILGLALAYLGRKGDAIRLGKQGVALLPIKRDAYNGPYLQHQLARIYLLAGEPEKALDQLEPLLRIPYYLSPGWLKIDRTFTPLRGNPRFERLVNDGSSQ
jgi:eukaryotic-like serine/threonine-protein kinase